jgi:hypothetical protein
VTICTTSPEANGRPIHFETIIVKDSDVFGQEFKEVLIQIGRVAMDLHSRSRLKAVAYYRSFHSEKAL